MFGILAALLAFALLSFGGVLRQTWLALEILSIASGGIMLAVRSLRRQPIDIPLLAFITLLGIMGFHADGKLLVGGMPAGWAYLASRAGEDKIRRFFHFVLLFGLLEALLGLAQYLIVPGWILGYQSPLYEVSGTLINRNHFAGLLEMFVPVAFGLAYMSARHVDGMARQYVYLFAGAFIGLALFFSGSRMGILSFLTTVIFL